MTLYLDVIWLLNFFIDFLLLQLTAFVLKRTVTKRRLFVGALVASVFIFFLFTPFSSLMYHPLMKFAYSVVIVWIVFGFKRFYAFVQVLFMFYFVTFMVGGGMFALHYFMQGSGTILNGIASHTTPYGDVFSWSFVMIGFPCMWFFSKQRIGHIKAKKVRYDQMVVVEIDVGDEKIKTKGFIDSGNHLHDPITKTPVMILQMDSFKDRFPKQLLEYAKDPTGLFSDEDSLPVEWQQRIRLIPYRGVGKRNDFLLAFKPDSVKLTQNQDVYVCHKVFVGLNEGRLSGEDEYKVIVHPKLLTGKTSAQPAS
ncbi:MAG TPA: sigma-E processing peptidase SpoIIGA [Bacillales bacterium]|nr:sigma-E processing peptidase SpoIIGA [Bacillales bacterium]